MEALFRRHLSFPANPMVVKQWLELGKQMEQWIMYIVPEESGSTLRSL